MQLIDAATPLIAILLLATVATREMASAGSSSISHRVTRFLGWVVAPLFLIFLVMAGMRLIEIAAQIQTAPLPR